MLRTLTWIACLWPGFAGAWVRGRWSGLAAAFGFGLVLNLALLTTFGGLSLPALGHAWAMPAVAWGFVLGFWALGAYLGRFPALSPCNDQLLAEAQTQYLRGHWIEAESLLGSMLSKHPEDAEARLLLASLLRRTGRHGEAKRMLSELIHDESAARWRWEIQSEMSCVAGNHEQQSSRTERRAA
jgi:hypothetical protein